jgi:hypothetical protein
MPVLLLVLLVAASSIGAGYLVSRHFLKKANLKPSHKGLLVGGFAGASVFLLHLVLKQFGIDLFRGVPNQVFQSALALILLSYPTRMMFVRRRSGSELADLGPSPLRTMFLVLGLLMIVLSAVGLFTLSLPTGQSIFSLAQGITFLAFGLIHSQIRRSGICYREGLLPWSRIACYEWNHGSTLMLDLHRKRWWQDRVQLPVPPVLVERVDQLMRQHVPAKS